MEREKRGSSRHPRPGRAVWCRIGHTTSLSPESALGPGGRDWDRARVWLWLAGPALEHCPAHSTVSSSLPHAGPGGCPNAGLGLPGPPLPLGSAARASVPAQAQLHTEVGGSGGAGLRPKQGVLLSPTGARLAAPSPCIPEQGRRHNSQQPAAPKGANTAPPHPPQQTAPRRQSRRGCRERGRTGETGEWGGWGLGQGRGSSGRGRAGV